jgi:hypothetical protein
LGQDSYTLVATNRLYVGPSYPSAVCLPVVSGQPAQPEPRGGMGISPFLLSNPFRDSAQLVFTLIAPARLAVRVYDLAGHETAQSLTCDGHVGMNALWIGEELAPGAYVILLRTPTTSTTLRAVKIR